MTQIVINRANFSCQDHGHTHTQTCKLCVLKGQTWINGTLNRQVLEQQNPYYL